MSSALDGEHKSSAKVWSCVVAAAFSLVLAAAPAVGQAEPTAEPWFGVPLPPGVGEEAAVIIGDRGPVPARFPAGEERHRDLIGSAIHADLERVISFSRESRERREIGNGQLWGRVTGFPSSARTVDWAVAEFRRAGIADVRVQTFEQSAGSEFWLPLSWEVRVLGDNAFGEGSRDVILHSAMPLSPSVIASGSVTAPVVYVGTGSPAVLAHIDVRGKIVVQQVTPQGHMVFERGPTVARAQDMMRRGAVAVINVVRLPGNEHARDFSNCGGPCFNVGGRDGLFLENVLDRAAEAGMLDRVRVRLSLDTDRRSGLSAQNGVAIVPGTRTDEYVIINAHVDAWFDGAGDNADGVAVMMALARHFARPENRPARTLVFVASAGHHSPGLSGPANFVSMNPEIVERTVLMLNIEHVAQRNIVPARSVGADGYRETIADAGEAPIVAGVTNRSPFVEDLIREGVDRYGVNFVSQGSAMSSGETGGYSPVPGARVTVMQAPPLYHTSGEGIEVISTPGLERMARFFAYFIREVAAAPRDRINP